MEEVMPEQPQPDRVPDDDPPPHPAEPLKITTPAVDRDFASDGTNRRRRS